MLTLTFFAISLCLSIAAAGPSTAATDFCDPNICSGGRHHIGCGHSGNFDPNCPADATMVDLTGFVNTILHLHNTYRASTANGQVNGLPTASRMVQVTWNAELARIASYNVRQCVMRHDECRNTNTYRFAGQNLAGSSSWPNFGPVDAMVSSSITRWFNESQSTTPSDISSCCPNLQRTGHFTQMVSDGLIEIGCAASAYSVPDPSQTIAPDFAWRTHLFACNYNFGNMQTWAIYTAGPTGSGCVTGQSKDYPGLCNVGEPIRIM